MIVVVNAEAQEGPEDATTQSRDYQLSTSVPAALALLKRLAPDLKLLVTVASSVKEVQSLVDLVRNAESLNYLVLVHSEAEGDVTIEALLTRVESRHD